jgi:structural maintenance of chromosome 2
MIVDTEVTAKKLLQKGQLRRRTTIIPLNKIVGHSLEMSTVRLAQQLVSCRLMEILIFTSTVTPEKGPVNIVCGLPFSLIRNTYQQLKKVDFFNNKMLYS